MIPSEKANDSSCLEAQMQQTVEQGQTRQGGQGQILEGRTKGSDFIL